MSGEHPLTTALTSVIAFSGEPMALSDPNLPDNPITAVNAPFEALTGYPRAETVGRNCRFLQGPGTDPEAPRRIRAALDAERGCIEWIVNHRRDGRPFWNLLFLTPVRDRDGRLLNFFANQRDFTQGRPQGLPDHSFGRADLSADGAAEFNALLLDALEQTEAARDPALAAGALLRLVEAARRLDRVTTRLSPAPWSPPPG